MASGEMRDGTWISERRIRAVARAEGLTIPRHLENKITEDGGVYAMNLGDDEIRSALASTWGSDVDTMEALPERVCGR